MPVKPKVLILMSESPDILEIQTFPLPHIGSKQVRLNWHLRSLHLSSITAANFERWFARQADERATEPFEEFPPHTASGLLALEGLTFWGASAPVEHTALPTPRTECRFKNPRAELSFPLLYSVILDDCSTQTRALQLAHTPRQPPTTR